MCSLERHHHAYQDLYVEKASLTQHHSRDDGLCFVEILRPWIGLILRSYIWDQLASQGKDDVDGSPYNRVALSRLLGIAFTD